MNNTDVRIGTITGTLASIFATVTWGRIEETVVLGAIAAAVSFLVSHVLRRVLERKR